MYLHIDKPTFYLLYTIFLKSTIEKITVHLLTTKGVLQAICLKLVRVTLTATDKRDNSKKFRLLCLQHVKEFNKNWTLENAREDIDAVLKEAPFMRELRGRIVPLIVDEDDFWRRYFFAVQTLRTKIYPPAAPPPPPLPPSPPPVPPVPPPTLPRKK